MWKSSSLNLLYVLMIGCFLLWFCMAYKTLQYYIPDICIPKNNIDSILLKNIPSIKKIVLKKNIDLIKIIIVLKKILIQ